MKKKIKKKNVWEKKYFRREKNFHTNCKSLGICWFFLFCILWVKNLLEAKFAAEKQQNVWMDETRARTWLGCDISINKSKPTAKFSAKLIKPLDGPEGPSWWSRRLQPSAWARKGPQSYFYGREYLCPCWAK